MNLVDLILRRGEIHRLARECPPAEVARPRATTDPLPYWPNYPYLEGPPDDVPA